MLVSELVILDHLSAGAPRDLDICSRWHSDFLLGQNAHLKVLTNPWLVSLLLGDTRGRWWPLVFGGCGWEASLG